MLITRFISSFTILLLCVALVLTGCYTKKDNNTEEADPATISSSEPASQPAEADREATAVSGAPAKVNVNVFLEISNGMKGFMPAAEAGKKPTEFQSRLNKLVSEVQDGKYVATKRFFLAKEDKQGRPVLDSVSYNTFKSTFLSGINEKVFGTPLPDLLQAALEKSLEQGAVSVIISDFIHGPHPNKQGGFISLDSDIRSSLKQAEHQNLVVAVIAEASGFYGIYHPAVKKPETRRTLNGDQIPFYIWVIGKQQDVQVVTSKVLGNLPPQQAYFGFAYGTLPYAAILKDKAFWPAGNVYCASLKADPCTAIKLQPQKNEPVEFTVGLNLSALPLQMQRVNYLKSNLKVSGSGCRATLISVTAADAAVKATPGLARYTHFVRLQVPQLLAGTGAVSIQLPQVLPSWIQAWSTDNDNNPAAAPKKTYQLNKIINGVQALYRDQHDYLFNVTIKFNKAD